MTDPDEFVGAYTDWSGYDVPKLASFLDEDLSAAWSQVRTWGQTYDLVSRHVEVLRRTRGALAAAWPPERSQAAQAFFSVLDELIASMDEMQGMAVTNGASLHGILTSLGDTKRTVDALHEQWKVVDAVESAKGEYYDPSSLDELNQQAQARMRTNDEAVIEYYPYLSVPTPYTPPHPRREKTTGPMKGPDGPTPIGGKPSSGPTSRPPAIPPVAPLASSGTSTSGPTLSAAPRASLQGESAVHSGRQDSSSARDWSQVSAGAGLLDPSNRSWFVETSSGRALRPGGVIGGPSAEPSVVPGQQGTRQESGAGASVQEEPGRGINPVGGVLGGPLASGIQGDRRSRVGRLPPETEWEVRTGVPPVLLPPPEPTKHDPGPGVIGIDR